MSGATPGSTPPSPSKHEQATFAFHEYQMVAEDTAKITDRRQTVNTLFVSINAIFLTAVGFLLYTFFQTNGDGSHIVYYAIGFLAIAFITTRINNSWLGLSEQSRKLIDLRIRYLEELEAYLRGTGFFPTLEIRLKGMDPEKDKEYEGVPPTFPGAEKKHPDIVGTIWRWMNTRGTYSLEEVLYNNPNPKFKVFGFSRAEQLVGRTFTYAYWAAFAVSLIAVILEYTNYYSSLYFSVGPFHF